MINSIERNLHCRNCDHLGQVAQETDILSNRKIISHRQIAWYNCLRALDSLPILLM